jgi:capsular polysaccharide transport system permease protein
MRAGREHQGDRSFYAGLRIQARCLGALMIREMMMRYGRGNIGFLWIVLEPMILTGGVMLLWSFLKSPYEHGMQIVSFVLTGYMPLTLWRHLTSAGIFAFRRSIGLLYHRQISLIDVVAARMLLEFCGTTAALTFVYAVLLLGGIVEPMHDPGLVMLAWCLMGLLSLGVGINFAVLTEYSEVTERFIQPIQYLMLPISGCFFMVELLPTRAQELALFNPTVHCYEMFRAGFFGEAVTAHFSPWYPLVWAMGLITIGIASIDSVRDHLNTG